jgi:hypothetical protein
MNTSTSVQYPLEALRLWLSEMKIGSSGRDHKKDIEFLEQIVSTVFFAGMGREESELAHVRIAYHSAGIDGLRNVQDYQHVGGGHYRSSAWEILRIKARKGITNFSVPSLIKIAPAANLPRSAVVVGPRDGRLMIQGLARRIEFDEFSVDREEEVLVVHAPEPGHVVIFNKGKEVFRYENGERINPERRVQLRSVLFDKASVCRLALAAMNADLLAQLKATWFTSDKTSYVAEVVHDLVEKMVSTKHGGIIAMLPAHSVSALAVGIGATGKYRFHPDDSTLLATRLKDSLEAQNHLANLRSLIERNQAEPGNVDLAQNEERLSKDALAALIDSIAHLTVVDNALLMGPNLGVVCAGYPVVARRGNLLQVYEATDVRGTLGDLYVMGQHGSRHRAAALFASQHPGGLVFVASQDGQLRCFSRLGEANKMVLVWRIQIQRD